MRSLRLATPAQTDYLQAVTWYEERQSGLGREFEIELEALFGRIKRNPESFPIETSATRKARMPRFKHGIFFTVAVDEIGVLAIYHPSRNPRTLRKRLK